MPPPTILSGPVDLQTDTSWYTLEPLRTEGPDALRPTPGIRKITLREIESHWPNAPDDITIHKADDLFGETAAAADPYGPILAKATLTRATFDFELEGSPRPHKVSICPPDHVTVECRADANPIRAWLARCRFRIARACRTLALALFTLAGTVGASEDEEAHEACALWGGWAEGLRVER